MLVDLFQHLLNLLTGSVNPDLGAIASVEAENYDPAR
jgi:hypothetical protein